MNIIRDVTEAQLQFWGAAISPMPVLVEITPILAQRLLDLNFQNRRVKPNVVAHYATLMTLGQWRITNETLGIDWNGVFLDGQHRLHAVIKSGVTIQAIIIFGLDPDTRLVVNTGKSRTLVDAVTVSGREISHLQAAVARNMRVGVEGVDFIRDSRQDQVAYYVKYENTIDFAVDIMRRVSSLKPTAPFGGAIARATISGCMPTQDIHDFADALTNPTGPAGQRPGGHSAFLLSQELTGRKTKRHQGEEQRSKLFSKTEKALTAFVTGHRCLQLKASGESIFPRPKL